MSAVSSLLFENVLLIEDEPHLRTALEIAFRKLGITSHSASTISEAADLLSQRAFELLVLDRNLPDGDGIALLSSLRSQGYAGCILMLTAMGQTEDRIEGLNRGADDYLPKPFSWEELEARVRALARRRPAAPTELAPLRATGKSAVSIDSHGWVLDESRLRVLGPKGWTELTPLEFKLAARLIAAQGSIVTRDNLLKDVWGFTLLPKTRTVDHFLGRLRKHFEANPEEPRHFLTVRGAGYRFEG